MKLPAHKHTQRLLYGANIVLSFMFVMSVGYAVTVNNSKAAAGDLAGAQTTLNTAITSVQTASAAASALATQNAASLQQALTTAVTQGLSATGVNATSSLCRCNRYLNI